MSKCTSARTQSDSDEWVCVRETKIEQDKREFETSENKRERQNEKERRKLSAAAPIGLSVRVCV